MRQRELAVLIKNLGKLTRSQRQRVVMELTAGEHKMAAVEVIEGIGAYRPSLPALRRRASRQERLGRRPPTVQMPSLSQDVQHAYRYATGAPAHEGKVVGADRRLA